MKTIKIALLTLFLWATSPLSAVFFQAHEYIHPTTGQTVWLFGDFHKDFDQEGTLSKLQQEIIINAAQKKNVLIIAETRTSKWLSLTDVANSLNVILYIPIFLYALKNKQYSLATLSSLPLGLSCFVAYQQYLHNKKPALNSEQLIKKLKQFQSPSLNLFDYSPLRSLVEKCRTKNIRAIDIEFRYHDDLACIQQQCHKTWGKLLGEIDFFGHRFDHWFNRFMSNAVQRYPITVADYCDINNAILEELESYDHDNPALKNLYSEYINQYKQLPTTQFLYEQVIKNPDQSLATIVPSLAKYLNVDQLTALQYFRIHNWFLLDARAIHQIHNNQSVKTIFVCTGALHTENIAFVLEQLNYVKKSFHGYTLENLDDSVYDATNNTINTSKIDYLTLDLEKILA